MLIRPEDSGVPTRARRRASPAKGQAGGPVPRDLQSCVGPRMESQAASLPIMGQVPLLGKPGPAGASWNRRGARVPPVTQRATSLLFVKSGLISPSRCLVVPFLRGCRGHTRCPPGQAWRCLIAGRAPAPALCPLRCFKGEGECLSPRLSSHSDMQLGACLSEEFIRVAAKL